MSFHQGLDLVGQLGLSLAAERTARILAVGDPTEWVRGGNRLPSGEGLRFVSFAEVGPDLLRECDPQFVLSPVVARDFDCIDLAVTLCRLGYRNPYRALAEDLPSPDIIEREITQLCPALDFKVISRV